MNIYKSNRKNKKYKVLYNGKYIHFGDSRYEDFTNHQLKRRAAYIARASKIRHNGNLTINDPNSANYWAARVLWQYKD